LWFTLPNVESYIVDLKASVRSVTELHLQVAASGTAACTDG
jgi:hypothetical protein